MRYCTFLAAQLRFLDACYVCFYTFSVIGTIRHFANCIRSLFLPYIYHTSDALRQLREICYVSILFYFVFYQLLSRSSTFLFYFVFISNQAALLFFFALFFISYNQAVLLFFFTLFLSVIRQHYFSFLLLISYIRMNFV